MAFNPFVQVGNVVSGSTGASSAVTLTIPAAPSGNNTLYAFLSVAEGGSFQSGLAITPPSGWGLVSSNNPSGGQPAHFIYSITGSTGTSFTFTCSGAAAAARLVGCIGEAQGFTTISGSASFSTGSQATVGTITSNSITAGAAYLLPVSIFSYTWTTAGTTTVKSGWTSLKSGGTASATDPSSIQVAIGPLTTLSQSVSGTQTSATHAYATYAYGIFFLSCAGPIPVQVGPQDQETISSTAVLTGTGTLPTAPASTSVIIARVDIVDHSATYGTITPPSGWTLGASNQINDLNSWKIANYFYWRTGITGTSYAWTYQNSLNLGGVEEIVVQLFEAANANTSSPIAASGFSSGTAGTNVTSPSVTATAANQLPIAGLNIEDAASIGQTPTSVSAGFIKTGTVLDWNDVSGALGPLTTNGQSVSVTFNAAVVSGGTDGYQAGLILIAAPSSGITGTGAIKQDDQTVSASGSEIFTSTAASHQDDQRVAAAGQTFAGTGAVRQDDQRVTASGAETFTGTSAVRQDDQRVTASGQEIFTSTAAPKQDDQRVSASGIEAFVSTAAPHQDDQHVSASGLETFTATSALRQNEQSIAAAGQTFAGSAAVSQDHQHVSASGEETFAGTSTIKQDDQRITAAGGIGTGGTGAVSQDHQHVAASGLETFASSGSIAQDDQRVSSAGQTFAGTAAIRQDDQRVSSAGIVADASHGAVSQQPQAVASIGAVRFIAVGAVAQQPQTVSSTDAEIFLGSASVRQDDQHVTASGTSVATVSGSASVVQDDQRTAAAGTFATTVSGTAAITQREQVAALVGAFRNLGLGRAVIIDAGGYDMTSSTVTLIAVPGGLLGLGEELRLTPVAIMGRGLIAVYREQDDEFAYGGEWTMQLEIATATGEVFRSPPGPLLFAPTLTTDGDEIDE